VRLQLQTNKQIYNQQALQDFIDLIVTYNTISVTCDGTHFDYAAWPQFLIFLSSLPFTKITNLVLQDLIMTDCALHRLKHKLQSIGTLTSLYFHKTQISLDGMQKLVEILPTTNIRSLTLSSGNIDDRGMIALATVLPETKIHTLNIAFNPISALGIESLAHVLPVTQIRSLSFSLDNQNINQGIEALARVLPVTNISSLSITKNNWGWDDPPISDKTSKAIATALPGSQLQKLSLCGINFSDDTFKALVMALPATNIHTLYLEGACLNDSQIELLAKVLPTTRINALYLSCNRFGNQGAIALAEILPRTRIQVLHIDDDQNQIGEEGIKALRNVPGTAVHIVNDRKVRSRTDLNVYSNIREQKLADSWCSIWRRPAVAVATTGIERGADQSALLIPSVENVRESLAWL